jgi:nicotinate-nucleotide adenylyltransferase
MDAYLSLPSWLGWQQILDYVHLVVCRRETDQVPSPPLLALETSHQVETTSMLKAKPHGGLFFVDNTALPISSTEIRKHIEKKDDPSALLDPGVYAYILQEQLYAVS